MPEWQKTAFINAELHILSVDESYRVTLPKTLCDRANWQTGDQSLNVWLLLGGPGRCRLLSGPEVENQPTVQSLLQRISIEIDTLGANPLEFRNEASAALPLRLVHVEALPRGSGWRLALPRPIAAIMQIKAKEGELAAMIRQGYIELWTLQALRSAIEPLLTEIL
jgi:hypothetical protein